MHDTGAKFIYYRVRNDNMSSISKVLVKIFSYLPSSDRKNVRLVCSSWYKAACHHSITKQEKIVCLRDHDPKKCFKLLSRFGYSYLNIEFHGFILDRQSISFWKKCGYKIYSLTFIDCTFKKKVTKEMVVHCTQLVHLLLENCAGFFSSKVFDPRCSQDRIIRSNLRTINIKYDIEINDYVFSRFFEVYPLVKNIGVCLINDRCYNTTYKDVYFEQNIKSSEPVYESRKIFSHSAVYNKLKFSSTFVQGLEYREVDKDICQMYNNLFQSIRRNSDLKLKKFYFSPSSFSAPSETSLDAFFFAQNALKSVILKKSYYSSRSFSILLSSCPDLSHLELTDLFGHEMTIVGSSSIVLEHAIVEKLASSNLKSLTLHFDFRFEEGDYAYCDMLYNYKLKSLSIRSRSLLRKEMFLFVKTFCGLEYLDLSNNNVDDALVQVILKYQVNLVSLVLRFNNGITDFGLTGKSFKLKHLFSNKTTYSISRLQRLENLDLRNCKQITDVTMSELDLPNLKYLSMQNCNLISNEGFQLIAKKCPLLEYFDAGYTSITSDTLMKLGGQLRRLHFVDITFCDIDEESAKFILKMSNSLMYLCHTSNTYYFNILSKKWKSTKFSISLEVKDRNVCKCYTSNLNQLSNSRVRSCWKLHES